METQPLRVIAGTADKPLDINGITIPCYVLEDETRVLTQEGFLQAVGRHPKAKAGTGAQAMSAQGDKLPPFVASQNLKPFVSNELRESATPVRFATAHGATGFGYKAEILPLVCEVYLDAKNDGKLRHNQFHIAKRAEILMRGLARVGIIALVDEATGYQEIRAKHALAEILEKFIAAELRPWTKMFPYAFYEEIFRLKSWPGPNGARRPSVIGHYTNDVVYARIAPGVLKELRAKNPVGPSGRRPAKHHQWFTEDIGHPKLREHLASVITIMKLSETWDDFTIKLNRVFPRIDTTFEMPFAE